MTVMAALQVKMRHKTGRWQTLEACSRISSVMKIAASACLVAVIAGMTGASAAFAQSGPTNSPAFSSSAEPAPAAGAPASPAAIPEASAAPLPPPPPPPPPRRDGFFDAFGEWWQQSTTDFNASLEKLRNSQREFNERAARDAKEAADAWSRLPNTRIVEGREVCAIAPNGAPDCVAAAEKICRSKGFATGKSADIQSSRKCSARALITRSSEDCTMETIVVRAACQ